MRAPLRLLLGTLGHWARECVPFMSFAKAHQLLPCRRVTSESLVSKRVTSRLCMAEWEGPVFPRFCQLWPGPQPSQQWPWFVNRLEVSRSYYGNRLREKVKTKQRGGRKQEGLARSVVGGPRGLFSWSHLPAQYFISWCISCLGVSS